MRYTNPELLEHLASAYVLGTLAGGARRRFERLQRDRIDVRVRVTHWEARLGQLALSVPAHKPSPRVWAAIAARTQPTGTRQAPQGKTSWLGWLKPAGFGVGGLAAGVVAASVFFMAMPTLSCPATRSRCARAKNCRKATWAC